MKRPLFIVYYDLGLGGIQRKIVDIVNFLAKDQSNLDVCILLRRKSKFDLSREIKNKKAKIIYYPDWLKIRIPFFFPVFVLCQTWKFEPRAILAFSDMPGLSAVWTKLFFFWRKIRVVISEDPNTPLSKQISTYRCAFLRHFLIRNFYPFAEMVFTVNRLFLKDMIKTYHLPPKRIQLIPNWTFLVERRVLPKKRIYDLVFVGRISRNKNIGFLLRGVERLKKYKKDISLCLVGEGEEQKNLRAWVKDHHLKKNVFFVGPTSKVEDYLSRSKIFVLPSKSEGLPLAVLEAMALGIPVVSSSYPTVGELIQERKTGLIFHSQEELVAKVLVLLNNPRLYKKISQQAKLHVRKYHSPVNINFYLQALGLKNNQEKIKIGLITSRGGHLLQFYQLADWWRKYLRFWITDRGGDSDYLLKRERVYYGYFPENRNLLNAIRNFFLGLKILLKEKPDLLVSTGAGIAPPIFLAGKILGCKLIFIDSYTFVKYPSLSAKLVASLVDKLLVQHPQVANHFRKAEFWGAVL